MKDYKLLLTGTFDDLYMIDFVKFLKKENPHCHIYYWGPRWEFRAMQDHNCLALLDNYYTFKLLPGISRLSFLKEKYVRFEYRRHFKKFSQLHHFDIICLQTLKSNYTYVKDLFNASSNNILVVPWGNDVYKAGLDEKVKQTQLLQFATFVTGNNGQFHKLVKKTYNVPDEKFVSLKMGSALIDYIFEHKDVISTDEAKKEFGLHGKYVITCGHNAVEGQNHLAMIDAVCQVRDKLPSNLVLLFPFTYGGNASYVDTVKRKIEEVSLEAVFIEEYLNLPKLFLLRQATDMFIHVQKSDAGSTSVREYILCNKKVLNGEWLRYQDLESGGQIPYFVVDKLDNLGTTILNAYNSHPIKIGNGVLDVIEQRSWRSAIKKWNVFFESIS